MITVISREGNEQGKGIEDENSRCEMEGCNGTQYEVKWKDGEITMVCGCGLKLIDEETAQIL